MFAIFFAPVALAIASVPLSLPFLSALLCPEVAKADSPRSCLPAPLPIYNKNITPHKGAASLVASLQHPHAQSPLNRECVRIAYSWAQASSLYLTQLPKSRKLVSLTLLFLNILLYTILV